MSKLFLLASILLIACVQSKPIVELKANEKTLTKNQRIEQFYKPYYFDTLKVYSTQYLDDSNFVFRGKKLDSAQLSLFPYPFSFYYDEEQPIYACYRFKIDNNNVGLITRVYSEYTSTRIQLFVYDKLKDTIYNYRELAEDFGDGGEVFYQTSWLYYNKDKSVSCFTQEDRLYYHSVEDMNDTTVDRGRSYLYTKFLSTDTTSMIDKKLIKKFR